MGFFSKNKNKKNDIQSNDEYYYNSDIPVVEPDALPVGTNPSSDGGSKFSFDNFSDSLNTMPEIKFDDDDKPFQIKTTEMKELEDNNMYLATDYQNMVNPTASLFQSVQTPEDNITLDDELPYTNDDSIVSSNVDGTYSSVSQTPYEEDRVNEHKFFAESVDQINNYKEAFNQNNNEKKEIYGSANIFSIGRIDQPSNNDEELEKTKVIQFSSYSNNNSDNSKTA